MFSYTKVQTVLQSSQWDKQAQSNLGALLPRLGKNTLWFLQYKIESAGSEVLADEVIDIAQKQIRWYELISKNDSITVEKEFYQTWQAASNPGEQMLLNVVRDIRANRTVNAAVAPDLSTAFNYLTCAQMGEVGAVDVAEILSHGAVQAATFCNLSEEVKRYCYLKSIEDPQGREPQMFIHALENNSESIGTVKLKLATGEAPPLIKNWVQAFLEMGSKQVGRSTYNVAYFMTNHPVAAKLSPSSKEQLADILRLYNWLHVLTIIPTEIEHYEAEREEYFEQAKQNAITLGLGTINLDASDKPAPRAAEQVELPRNLGARAPRDVRYNGAKSAGPADSRYRGPKGLALDQKTNIKLDQEQARLAQARAVQKASIEKKLADLRKRYHS